MVQPIDDLNPLNLIHDELWAIIEGSERFASLVKPKNRIKFNSRTDANPLKQSGMTADFPEVGLYPFSNSGNLRSNSCDMQLNERYTFLLNTNDERANVYLLPVRFAILAALGSDALKRLRNLRFMDKRFVINASLADGSTQSFDAERRYGLAGWSNILTVEVVCHFPIVLLDTWAHTTSANSDSSDTGDSSDG